MARISPRASSACVAHQAKHAEGCPRIAAGELLAFIERSRGLLASIRKSARAAALSAPHHRRNNFFARAKRRKPPGRSNHRIRARHRMPMYNGVYFHHARGIVLSFLSVKHQSRVSYNL